MICRKIHPECLIQPCTINRHLKVRSFWMTPHAKLCVLMPSCIWVFGFRCIYHLTFAANRCAKWCYGPNILQQKWELGEATMAMVCKPAAEGCTALRALSFWLTRALFSGSCHSGAALMFAAVMLSAILTPCPWSQVELVELCHLRQTHAQI